MQPCHRHDDPVSYLQDLLMEVEVHLTAPTHTFLQHPDSEFRLHTQGHVFIVMCSLEAELHLPPNICGCAASAEPTHMAPFTVMCSMFGMDCVHLSKGKV
jgi:hypothetical protein